MKYNVYSMLVKEFGVEEDNKVIRYILFEDGTVFECCGEHGLLRNAFKLSLSDGMIMNNLPENDMNTVYDVLKDGVLKTFPVGPQDIECFHKMSDENALEFRDRMFKTEGHPCDPGVIALYRSYIA